MAINKDEFKFPDEQETKVEIEASGDVEIEVVDESKLFSVDLEPRTRVSTHKNEVSGLAPSSRGELGGVLVRLGAYLEDEQHRGGVLFLLHVGVRLVQAGVVERLGDIRHHAQQSPTGGFRQHRCLFLTACCRIRLILGLNGRREGDSRRQ